MSGVPAYALIAVLAAFAWTAWRLFCVWRNADGELPQFAAIDADDVDVH